MGNIDDIRDIVRGAIASLGGFGGRMIARLFLMIAAGHLYGAAPLGLLGQVAAITEVLAAVAVLGLKRSLLDLMSEDETGGRDPLNSFVAALVVSCLMAGLMSFALAVSWPYLFPDIAAPVVLFLAIPAIVFSEVAGTAIRFKRIIRWEVIARCVMEPWSFLLAALILFYAGYTKEGLLVAYSISALAAGIGMAFGLMHAFSIREVIKARLSWEKLAAVPRRSLAVGVTDVGTMMFRRADILALSLVVGHEATGIYYMAQQIVTVPHKIHQLFEPMLSPVVAALHHASERKAIAQKLAGICRWVFTLQLALTVPLLVFGSDILGLFGPEFALGAAILVALLFAELLDGSFALTETPLVFAKPKTPPMLILATLVIELASVYALALLWGAFGAAFGFLIAMAFLASARLYSLHKQMEINVLTASYGWPLLFAAAIGPLLMAIKAFGYIAANWQLGIAVFAAVALNLLLVRTLALTQLDRQIFKQLRAG